MNDEWETKINNSIKDIEKSDSSFLNLIALAIHQNLTTYGYNTNIDKLYDAIGYESFVKVIDTMGGRKVTIPKKKDFQETLMTVVIYYYKEIKHMSWGEIDKLFPYHNVAKVYTKKIGCLNNIIKEKIQEIMEEK